MRITSLVENTCHIDSLEAQHGLSLFIELSSCNILLDMGQDDLFVKNAESLGIDLSAVDFAVITHGHYDHGGGLNKFLQINSNAPVYLSRHAFNDYYNADGRYIGLDQKLRDNPRLHFVDTVTEILPGVTVHPAPKPFDGDAQGLSKAAADSIIPDDFLHELYLLITTESERTLFSGCSHRGILQILREFHPDIFVGGMHLSHKEPNHALRELAQCLGKMSVEFYTCHCTGLPQYSLLSEHITKLHYLPCGSSLSK